MLQQIEALQTQHSIAIKHRDQSEQRYFPYTHAYNHVDLTWWYASIILRLQNAESERDEAKSKLNEMEQQLADMVSV